MKVGDWEEDPLVEELIAGFPASSDLLVGPGDDCAVVRGSPGGPDLLYKTDCLVEQVHFLREHPSARIGWKAVGRVLSDIAAMAGRPRNILVTVAVPSDLPWDFLRGIYRGIRRSASAFGISLAGGETARSSGPIFLSVMGIGEVVGRPVLRSSAAADEEIWVTGLLGGSFNSGRHLRFRPRVREALWLNKHFSPGAMMDLSDGLGSDLPRLAQASGLGFQLEESDLPCSPGCGLRQAISDGEDYELLFTLSPAQGEALAPTWAKQFPKLRLSRIGKMTSEASAPLPFSGYQHFSG